MNSYFLMIKMFPLSYSIWFDGFAWFLLFTAKLNWEFQGSEMKNIFRMFFYYLFACCCCCRRYCCVLYFSFNSTALGRFPFFSWVLFCLVDSFLYIHIHICFFHPIDLFKCWIFMNKEFFVIFRGELWVLYIVH